MGNCLGHCRLSRETFSQYMFHFKPRRESVSKQISSLGKTESEEHIISDLPALHEKDECNSEIELDYNWKNKYSFWRLKSIFSNVKNQYVENSAFKLELLDDEWSISEEEGEHLKSAEIKEPKSCASASLNSLDLEWEHLPEMTVFFSKVEKEEPNSATSAEGWSRISSGDSLEWCSTEVEMKEDVDIETEQLLQEIEMLSSKTLQETKEWAS